MKNLVARFSLDESGATAIEYALIGVLISVAIISGAKLVGSGVGNMFSTVSSTVNTAI